MVSLINLAHPLAAAATAYAGAVVAGLPVVPEQVALLPVHWALLSVFLIVSGGVAANEIISKRTGRKWITLSAILLVIGNFIPLYFLAMEAFYVTITATALLLAYTAALKKIPLAGNVLVGLLVSVAVFFGALVQSNYVVVWPLALLAFLSVTAKEIYKAIDYALGEKMQAYSTIATKIGVIKARLLGSAFIAATIVSSFAPFFLNMSTAVYLLFAVVADIVFAAAAVSPLRFSSKLIRIATVIIFLAFLADAYNVRYLVAAA